MTLLTQTGLRINIIIIIIIIRFVKRQNVKRLPIYCSMADFPFFKMAAIRHLAFLKVGNFNFLSGSEAKFAPSYQILRRSVEPFGRYGRFSITQDGGRPPSWICFTRIGTTHEQDLVAFVTVQNLVAIGAVISILCKF